MNAPIGSVDGAIIGFHLLPAAGLGPAAGAVLATFVPLSFIFR